jgi:hypothetical protein
LINDSVFNDFEDLDITSRTPSLHSDDQSNGEKAKILYEFKEHKHACDIIKPIEKGYYSGFA